MKKNDNKRKKTDKKPFFDKKRKKKVIEIDEELDNVREVVVERDSGFNTIEVMVIILISVLFGIVIGCILNSTKSIGKEVSNEASEIITTYNAILENYYDEVDNIITKIDNKKIKCLRLSHYNFPEKIKGNARRKLRMKKIRININK